MPKELVAGVEPRAMHDQNLAADLLTPFNSHNAVLRFLRRVLTALCHDELFQSTFLTSLSW